MNVTLNNITYDFASNFKDDSSMRQSLNALTKATFDFDFERYYQDNYWNDTYIPYSLFHQDKLVANVSINVLDFCVFNEKKRYILIGTVMTDKEYRNRGLIKFLLEKVLLEWKDNSDMIYLFANDTVLDFYPKFGFFKKSEYQYTKAITDNSNSISSSHLDMDLPENRKLLLDFSHKTRCYSKLSAISNTGLGMFYATSFKKDFFYYLKEFDAVVFAEYKDDTLHLNDIFSTQDLDIDLIISAMATPATNKVILGFVPIDATGYTIEPYIEEDTTLFVLGEENNSIFDEHKLMIPILSHA